MLRARLVVRTALFCLCAVSAVVHAQEFRSMQITAWGSGFESASAVTTMVNYADSCNLNCVMPEIRLRCDAYYTSAIEPPGTGVAPSPAGFDSLADVIAKAHALNIEVHPWLVTWRIWTTTTGPAHMTPEHIWWTHGPGNTDPNQDWTMYSDTGAWDYGGVSNLDPGHPAVEDYLITVFMDIVSRYDVDGLNLDYIRYPATNWGYNPVSVQRFNAEYGRTGSPSSSDVTWLNWRRDQITNLVKRLYLEIKAVKPLVKLNADVWNSATTGNNSYLQNWDNWMSNHWMDFAHPMSYTSTNSTFESWCAAYVNNQHGRHVYPLVDCSNSVTGNVLPQIDLVRTYGFYGLGLYSYQGISNKSALQSALVSGPFPTKVTPPDMPWLSAPTLGMLKGFVKNAAGEAIYPATVTLQSRSTKNTGTGFYGFVDLATGTYTVDVSAPGYLPAGNQVTITAGLVSNLDFTLSTDTTPPTISNVRTANVQATNAQVLWDTDEAATSQVEYGLTTAYGSLTTEDASLVTAHAVQLTNLSPLTQYHYRVLSKDGAGNQSTSDDYTFTTTSGDVVADIIIDNPACTLVGAWTTGTSATDKYGADYYYCSTAASETKSARWTPNIITAGNYDVYVWYPQGSNRSAMAPYTVYYDGGSVTVPVNQTTLGGRWNLIASAKPFLVGTGGSVKLGNGTGESSKVVMADAVKLVYVPGADTQPPTVPTNLAATPASATQVNLTWTASTDNVGVTGYKVFRNSAQIGTSATTAYSDTDCSPNTTYTYTVSAHDAANNESAQSAPANATTPPDTTPPSAPANLSATPASVTQVNLAWTASTDNVAVTGYRIYRDSAQIGTSVTTSYSDTTCTPNTTYAYAVSAYDAADNESAQSAPANATTPPDTTPPTAPTNLSATPASGTQVDLAWTASTDNVAVTGYRIYRDSAEIGTSATTSYSDTTCVPNTTYTYEVSAYDAASHESARSTPAVATTPTATDVVIDNVSATFAGSWILGTSSTDKYGPDYQFAMTAASETATAIFRPSLQAGNYDVYCWYPQGSNRSAMAPYTVYWNGGSQTIPVNQQAGGGQWNLLVSAKPFLAGTSGYVTIGNGTGEASKAVMADAVRFVLSSDTQPPTVPTNLAATPISKTRIDLAWTASTDNVGVTGYKVFRNGGQIGTSATTSYSDTTCSPNTTYSYTVSAYDAASNESAQSAPASATTPATSVKDYAPSATSVTRGTVSSGSVTNLAANDSSYLVITAQRVGGTRYVDWYSSVTIAEAPASVTKLTITFDGKLSASLTQRLYIYNWTTSSWTQIDSRTVGTSDVTVSWNTTSPASYISSSGQIRLRQYVTRSSAFTSSSDFTRFTVEY